MQFYVKKMEVPTFKNVSDAIILAISDLHYTKSLGTKFLNNLTLKIESLSPDYICFLGDLVDDDSKEVIEWLNILTKLAPVYFVYGNHDISRYIPKKDKDYDSYLRTMYEDLRNIKGLEVLNSGNKVINNNYTFTGLPFLDIDEHDKLIRYSNNYFNMYLNQDEFNTILVHNPWIMNEEVFNQLKPMTRLNTDIILSGHTHSGMVPHFLDEKLPGNRGLFAPSQGLFPKMTRGYVDSYLFENSDAHFQGAIVPALRTVPDIPELGDEINRLLYPPAIQLVRVKREK